MPKARDLTPAERRQSEQVQQMKKERSERYAELAKMEFPDRGPQLMGVGNFDILKGIGGRGA